MEVSEGQTVKLSCQVSGIPSPEVTWCMADKRIKDGGRIAMSFDEDGVATLIVEDVGIDDEGEYSCEIINKHGNAKCTAELLVNCK